MASYRPPRSGNGTCRPVSVAALLSSTLMLFAGATALRAAEPAYPSKPIRLIVASSTGGPNDILARLVTPAWGEALGRQFVIENRPGAGGMLGTEIVARAVPDGYTLLVGYPGPLIIGPLLSNNPPYNGLKDFAPVSLSVSAPFLLVVHPSVPAKSMKELVALAKAHPGKLNYATGGAGTSSHMVAELFKLVAGIDLVHVPYKGAGPSLTGLVAGEVATTFVSITAGMPLVKSGRLRALGVGGLQRSPLLPDVLTIKESGYAFDAGSWYGMLAPQATPAAVVDKLHTTLTQAMNTPSIRTRLIEMAFEVNASSPEQFANHLRAEHETWSKVIAAAGLRSK